MHGIDGIRVLLGAENGSLRIGRIYVIVNI